MRSTFHTAAPLEPPHKRSACIGDARRHLPVLAMAMLVQLMLLGTAPANATSDDAPGVRATTRATPPPALAADIRQALPTPRLVGQHKFTYWGFEVYDARLWSNAAFAPEAWVQQTLVLELRYLRDFQGADIAQRSLDEIQGQRKLSAAQAQDWLLTLQTAIPNVRRGERLSGIYRPGKGLVLLHQDRPVGELQDPQLAQRFMGIWLAPETSQRQLRQQLLGGAQ